MSDIHAHNLLNLLRETPMSRDELAQHFGADARFHTCKLNDLDLDALLTFYYSAIRFANSKASSSSTWRVFATIKRRLRLFR